MKSRFYMSCFLFLFSLTLLAQKNIEPEKIYSVTKVVYPISYYKQQVNLWKGEIEKNEQNSIAWGNYYAASRAANLLTPFGKDKPYNLDSIVSTASKMIPESYDFHRIVYWNGGGNQDLFHHLEKAYAMAPERSEIDNDLITYYELNRNEPKMQFFCKKAYQSGAFAPEVLSWNYNALMSVEEDAILITYGDNDTYPVWLLQNAKNVRPDVAVLNIHLIQQKEYRDELFRENGIPAFEQTVELVADRKSISSQLLNHLFQQKDRPVYLGVAVSRAIREMHSSNLYLVGLTFKYSEEEFDNIAVLKNNVENKFLLDYLRIDLNPDIGTSVVNKMNANYIPSFLLLYKHYKTAGQLDKADHMRALLTSIAHASGVQDEVMTYFEENPKPSDRFESAISVKDLQNSKEKIRGNLYADQTELTIKEYDKFLQDLLKQKEYKKLDQCRPQKVDWRALAKERLNKKKAADTILINKDRDNHRYLFDHSRLPDDSLFYNGHPDAERSPVQNISHEAATFYCEWVTELYNRSTSKKKKFKKVIFRLPTEAEWVLAATAGGEGEYSHCRGGIKNVKGCFLYNFNVAGEPCKGGDNLHAGNDGAFFAVRADAYFPNDFGLYNTSGNVSEMIDQKGIAKGGSWADMPERSTVQSVQKYNAPDPSVGFRVFMEVLEY